MMTGPRYWSAPHLSCKKAILVKRLVSLFQVFMRQANNLRQIIDTIGHIRVLTSVHVDHSSE